MSDKTQTNAKIQYIIDPARIWVLATATLRKIFLSKNCSFYHKVPGLKNMSLFYRKKINKSISSKSKLCSLKFTQKT